MADNVSKGAGFWSNFNAGQIATGGTVTTIGNIRIHTFNSAASLVTPNDLPIPARVLTVGAGGGGGGGEGNAYGGAGGGGGGGDVIDTALLALAVNTSLPAVIGSGGGGGTSGTVDASTNGGIGGSSTFSGISAIGGGAGGTNAGNGSTKTTQDVSAGTVPGNGVANRGGGAGGGTGRAGGSGGSGIVIVRYPAAGSKLLLRGTESFASEA